MFYQTASTRWCRASWRRIRRRTWRIRTPRSCCCASRWAPPAARRRAPVRPRRRHALRRGRRGRGSTSDGGSAQLMTRLRGKVLRIDVSGAASDPYTIPPDNPFVGSPSGWRGEIWALGLHDPVRFDFDLDDRRALDARSGWAAARGGPRDAGGRRRPQLRLARPRGIVCARVVTGCPARPRDREPLRVPGLRVCPRLGLPRRRRPALRRRGLVLHDHFVFADGCNDHVLVRSRRASRPHAGASGRRARWRESPRSRATASASPTS